MVLQNGYELTTTFYEDFSIADMFGASAVKDTYKRAFKEWKTNYVYLTELVVVLNLKCWSHYYKGNKELSALYSELYYKANDYALSHLKGDEFTFFYNVTD